MRHKLMNIGSMAALLVALLSLGAHAAELQVGQTAPAFSLPDQDGVIHSLAEYRGKTVVLAFYPKDFTAG
jgi:peroxiredoxin Q/BCP